jgi:hypothetical protein
MIKKKIENLKLILEYIPSIEKSVSLLEEEFETFDKDHLIKDSKEAKNTFEEEIFNVYYYVIYEELPKNACKLLMELNEILYNWNRLTRQGSNKLTLLTLMLNRLLELKEAAEKQTEEFVELSCSFRDFYNWSPKAFSLSKDYLEQLLE